MPVTRGFGIVGTGVIAAIHADAIALLSKTGCRKPRSERPAGGGH